jgi:hypothetical protein
LPIPAGNPYYRLEWVDGDLHSPIVVYFLFPREGQSRD